MIWWKCIIACIITLIIGMICGTLCESNNRIQSKQNPKPDPNRAPHPYREPNQPETSSEETSEPYFLAPFMTVEDDVRCPKCRALTRRLPGITYGLRSPKVCKPMSDESPCPARNEEHLHCYCYSCESKWMMKVAP